MDSTLELLNLLLKRHFLHIRSLVSLHECLGLTGHLLLHHHSVQGWQVALEVASIQVEVLLECFGQLLEVFHLLEGLEVLHVVYISLEAHLLLLCVEHEHLDHDSAHPVKDLQLLLDDVLDISLNSLHDLVEVQFGEQLGVLLIVLAIGEYDLDLVEAFILLLREEIQETTEESLVLVLEVNQSLAHVEYF